MRLAMLFAAVVILLSGIFAGTLAVRSSGNEVVRAQRPATADGKGPEAVARVEPAMAEILFARPVRVDEILRIVGEENRGNLTTMEGTYRAGGEEIKDSFSVPSRLETAGEIEHAWARARVGSLADMSRVPKGPVVEELGMPRKMGDGMEGALRTQADGMRDAMKSPKTREILVTKASLEGTSPEMERLPAEQSGAIERISVVTRSELLEMIDRVTREAKRRGEPPPSFN